MSEFVSSQPSKTYYSDYRRPFILGALVGLSLALTFIAGYVARDVLTFVPGLSGTRIVGQYQYPLLDEVQLRLDRYYLRDQPDESVRQYAAIRGMLVALEDRYTFFVEPPVAQSESDVLAGTYGGIGVEIQRNESGELLLFPFPDSPAFAAGIEPGDILVEVNGNDVDVSVQPDVLDQMFRGEVRDGNGIEVAVRKPEQDELFRVFVAYAVINVPSVTWRIADEANHIGYIRILRFTSRTPEELRIGLTALQDSGITALILDLRDNNGGLLQESIEVASEFLDGVAVLYERQRDDERVFEAEPGGLASELPLAVVINGGTASAAELVAGAIRDHERGILIGQTTFGKGTVQQIFRLSDDSSVHITSAEWLTPNRNTLDGVGLEPNIAMIPDENGRDVELGEAIRQLQQIQLAQAETQ